MRLFIVLCAALLACGATSGGVISKAWVADNGDGTFKNPVINADYSDPDVVRVGKDYYMTASSFNCVPGLPILHSNDLVNWRIVNHALRRVDNGVFDFGKPQHGKGVWAPSIRHHDGIYYIFWGDPDCGILFVKSHDVLGEWSEPTVVKAGRGMIDASPLWDDDGRMYIVHAYAGSRAGMKSVLALCEVKDGRAGESRIIFDGHITHPTLEGPKFYKRDGYYYIFAPAGGVATGWQMAFRSKNIYGPYEDRVVLAQGKTSVNGPHQGGWVTTPDGKQDWFMHFQDKYAYGRVVHLQPVKWVDGWPVMGVDTDGTGCGEPVLRHKKPDVGATYPIATPADSDDFDSRTLGLQWQWHANPQDTWHYAASERSVLRLYSVSTPDDYRSLWDTPNLLLQKTPADEFTATMKFDFAPLSAKFGERAGLVVMGRSYAALTIQSTTNGAQVAMVSCAKAENGAAEQIEGQPLGVDVKSPLWFRVTVGKGGVCGFSMSRDGRRFVVVGKPFTLMEGVWIGAKIGMFISRPFVHNDSGWIDVDSFVIDK